MTASPAKNGAIERQHAAGKATHQQRPLLVAAVRAQSDNIAPHWRTVGECMVDLRKLYVWMKAEEKFVSLLGAGGHDFPEPIRKMSYDFLDRWLKGAAQQKQ